MKSSQNSFSNILFSIIIPVLILNKGKLLGLTPLQALVIALLFPLIYGAHSFYKNKKFDFISLLGLLNVLVSGTLAWMALGGIWFAIKEAFFPLLIGVFVYFSSFGKEPFFKTIFLNPSVLNIPLIDSKLDSIEKKAAFERLMSRATQFLSLSFLLSSVLNFVTSMVIFKPLAESLSMDERREILNQQLGQMTLYSMLVIVIPSMICIGLIIYYAFKKISNLTGLKVDEFVAQDQKSQPPSTGGGG